MDARDNQRRLSDQDIERLLTAARPEPASLSDEAARALFHRAMEASRIAAPKRPLWAFGAPRWALATATCVFAFAVARVAWTPDAPLPTAAVEPPAAAVPVPAARADAVASAPAPAPVVRGSADALRFRQPVQRMARSVRHGARAASNVTSSFGSAEADRKPAPDSQPVADESLASVLIVTADNSPANVTAVEGPPDTEGFARVAAYDETADGAPVVHECVVTRDGAGELRTEFASASPGDPEQGPYLKVEAAASPAP